MSFTFFTRPTDPVFLLENDCKHQNMWGWSYGFLSGLQWILVP